LIFSSKYRRNVFDDNRIRITLNDIISGSELDFKILQFETDRNHIHFLIDYDPKISVTQIVRHLKQITTVGVWKKHRYTLRELYWKERTLWADGYFVCSIGGASPETIRKYIENQG
jgi:putative transposase